jgi:hypothetical protein
VNFHYYVLLENSTIELDECAGYLDDPPDGESIVVLPSEPESFEDGRRLRDLVIEAIDLIAAEEKREFEQRLEHEGVAADLAPPPDWLIALGIWMADLIIKGASWEILKGSALRFTKRFISKERAAFKQDPMGMTELEVERFVKMYMGKDFSDEGVLKELYLAIRGLHAEKGECFDRKVFERNVLDKIIEQRRRRIAEKRRRREEEEAEKDNRRAQLIEAISRKSPEGQRTEGDALRVIKHVDVYLLNGIESVFVYPIFSPEVRKAVKGILSNEEIPDSVLTEFQEIGLLNASNELTEFGQKVFVDLVCLRSNGKIPSEIFRNNDKSQGTVNS